MDKPLRLAIAAVLGLFAAVALAADRGHDGRGARDRGASPRWHGDIHTFGHHDAPIWRAGRWHHGSHGGRLGWWWVVAGIWYFYPAPVYPYPDPFRPPVVAVPVPAPAPQQFWYYCAEPPGYYPYVPRCREAWQAVPATP